MEFPMSKLQQLILAAAMAGASLGASAQSDAEHAQHHPGGAASAPVASQPSSAKPAMDADKMASMDKQMKAMQETHQKMMSAKTPEERQAAMAEHMKMMHDGGMPMMKMGGDAKGMQCGMMGGNSAMMEQRMAHMESMMQTMMERLPAAPAKSSKPAK
jgi:hypothetical protein